MNRDPCARGLPDELLLRFFDDLSVEELCRLARVSRKWRAIALSHPTFWTKASLREWELERGGLQCFLARMARCPEADIITEFDFDQAVPEEVLTAVSANLHRITSLRMSCNVDDWRVDRLDFAAPQLQSLEIQSWKAKPLVRATSQSRSIFAGFAPRLHSIKLSNTHFLLSLAPTLSFPSVRQVDITYSAQPDDVNSDIFERVTALFPAVRTLRIELFNHTPGGPAERFFPSPLSETANRTMAGLDELKLCFSPACRETLRHLPLTEISKVELTNHVFNEVEIIPSLIPDGEFGVSYEGAVHPLTCRIVVFNFDKKGERRRVLEAPDGRSIWNCTRTMRACLISSQLVALSVDTRAWVTLLESFQVLPSLSVLRLVISTIEENEWAKGTAGSIGAIIHCPSLRTWVMDGYSYDASTERRLEMPCSVAHRFYDSVRFDQSQSTLTLRWVSLKPDGDDPWSFPFALVRVDDGTNISWFEAFAAQVLCAR
ncbi:hypothetical protein AURDEDRAFT_114436 [Auricularia subglabra TFB-10046 SS5]|nr:hypothetical protein AURDEDRAFT_114436 [Auricularia subglabra TFB-10046 SS5]